MTNPKLALIPSGYKSGKVYSILPNDATGDFDFDRASVGTRVRKDGLIEEVKTSGSITNELLYSEDYSQSNWAKTSVTVTTNQELAPDGTNTADKLDFSSSTSARMAQIVNLPTGNYTFSVYLRSVSGSGNFRLALIKQGSSGSLKTISLTEEWQRFDLQFTYDGLTNLIAYIGYYIDASYIQEVYSWGAMLSEGALSDYIKTEGTTETKTVETFTDVPRLDWLNSNCPTLNLEPQRTNDTTYSEDYTQTSYWNNVIDVVATKNVAIAPDGTFTANKIQANSGTNFKILRTSALTIPSGITMSMFVKRGNHDYIIFKAQGDYNFNLSTLQWGGSYSNVGYDDYGNGWIRLYATTTSSSLNYFGIYLSDSNFNQSWTATGNEFVYVWGAQYEVGDYVSSYIKTTGSTVTRLKDECLNGGDSDLFDITEGTFFVDANNFGTPLNTYNMITLSDGGNNFVRFIYESSRIRTSVYNGATQQDYFITGVNDNERNKVAITFKENEFKTYLNGVLKHTDTSGVVPINFDRLNFASQSGTSRHFEGKVYDTRVYDRVLTEAEAIELTT